MTSVRQEAINIINKCNQRDEKIVNFKKMISLRKAELALTSSKNNQKVIFL